MNKKIITIFFTLVLLMTTITSEGLSFTTFLNGSSIFNTSQPEWQQEYYQPLEPGELEIGEYRFAAGYAKNKNKSENSFYSNINDEIEPWGIMLNFDSVFPQELYFNMNYIYNPEYKDFDNDKNKMNSYALTLTHITEKDNRLFFGYSSYAQERKEYNSTSEEYSSPYRDENNYIYLGGEIRGNFPFIEKSN